MDFITSLPNSEGNSVIMVVADRLAKYTFVHYLIHLNQVQLLLDLWKQFKIYMETQRLL